MIGEYAAPEQFKPGIIKAQGQPKVGCRVVGDYVIPEQPELGSRWIVTNIVKACELEADGTFTVQTASGSIYKVLPPPAADTVA